jgi:flagellar basal body-associated protein FliL
MEGVKPDDFSALLAALNSRSAPPPPAQYPTYPSQFQPPQYMWQPVPVHQPPPAPVVVEQPPKSASLWIILLLVIAAIVFCVIAWMRTAKMVPEPEEKEEEKEEETTELPVPSEVSRFEKYDEEAVREFVASNLLNFTKEKQTKEEYVEIEELPEEIKPPSRRIIADESQEVIDYAKRRDALFKTA